MKYIVTTLDPKPPAVCANKTFASHFMTISQGKILFSFVVKMQNTCCKPNKIQSTPEQTKHPMIAPLFQGYSTPPKLIPMTPETTAPEMMTVPTQSIVFTRPRKLVSRKWSFVEGNNKRYTGATTAPMTKLM
jgi:hypothetical protein